MSRSLSGRAERNPTLSEAGPRWGGAKPGYPLEIFLSERIMIKAE